MKNNIFNRIFRNATQHTGLEPACPSESAPALAFSCDQGVGSIDRIEGSPLPIVRVFGWVSQAVPALSIHTSNDRRVQPLNSSRTRRPDVVVAGKSDHPYSGFRIEFLLDAGEQPRDLLVDDKSIYTFPGVPRYSLIDPHYKHFFTQDQVMGRGSVYGSGPPTNVSDEFKQFAQVAAGRVLDFGCGNGDLVDFLRGRGAVITGLELDEPRIRSGLKPAAAPYVVLYPGGVPLPFEDECFDWIVSTEVIEHVPGIADYVPEFARLLRLGGKLLITTPDITSIPSSFPAQCVPWHLLESTHIHFFTPQSVTRLFASHFDIEATYCLGATRFNGYFVPGSVGAIFVRR